MNKKIEELLQKKIEEIESQMKLVAENDDKLKKVSRKFDYFNQGKKINFKSESELEKFIESVNWEQFEKLEKEYPGFFENYGK